MNELKKIYDKIEPDLALVEETKRKMRVAVPQIRQKAWQIFKFAPALCLLAVCILIFALPDSGEQPETKTETTQAVTLYSVDTFYDEMLENSGGTAFMKAEAYVTGVDGGKYKLDIIAVERFDNANIPNDQTLNISLSVISTCSDDLQNGQAYTFWLFADNQGNWNIYGFLKGNEK